MKIIGVIPARYASTRFPGKPLALLKNKPLIQWVWERAKKIKSLSRVIVATDDQRIASIAKNFGAEVVMTKKSHPSGTDRVAEVLTKIPSDIVVNIQGDEPFINPSVVDQVIKALLNKTDYSMATLCQKIETEDEWKDPNVVKVVKTKKGRALYFSRYPIPYNREQDRKRHHFKHIGLYVYRTSALKKLVSWPVSKLESMEKLEQLRALENDLNILVLEARVSSMGIDTPEDLKKAQRLIK